MDKRCNNSKLALYCNLCCKKIMLFNTGEKSVRNHMNWDSHKKLLKGFRSINSFFFFKQPSFNKSSTITVPADAVCAKIIWAQNSFLANSYDDMSKTFKTVFLNSKVHCHFNMGAQRCFYINNIGIKPFFHNELV